MCPGLLVELALGLSIRTARKWLQGTWGGSRIIMRAEFLPTRAAFHTMFTQTFPSLVWLQFSYDKCLHSKTVLPDFELILYSEKGIFIVCAKVERLNSVWSTNKPKHACHSTQSSNTSELHNGTKCSQIYKKLFKRVFSSLSFYILGMVLDCWYQFILEN